MAEGPLAESFASTDREPPVFDAATNSVTMPAAFKKSYDAHEAAEWWRLSVPVELGGTLAPRSLYWATIEMVLGANRGRAHVQQRSRRSPRCCTRSATMTRRRSPS